MLNGPQPACTLVFTTRPNGRCFSLSSRCMGWLFCTQTPPSPCMNGLASMQQGLRITNPGAPSSHAWPSLMHTSSSWFPSSHDDAPASQLCLRLPPTLLQLVSCSKWIAHLAQETPSTQQVTRRSFPMQSCLPCTVVLLFSTATRRPVRTSLHQTTHAPQPLLLCAHQLYAAATAAAKRFRLLQHSRAAQQCPRPAANLPSPNYSLDPSCSEGHPEITPTWSSFSTSSRTNPHVSIVASWLSSSAQAITEK